ncbi:hypothetical protein ASPBRDRAFT_192819 [Aspergillus brasiliensis CBS 101740]|uniref:Uncharacterized protein n=1 Tax=Aspergillus brasiliensis (strain CBS 101740 / IMI 381727 / IBT 21946) TaxID=767769 RepID=A0A1L9UYC8_ASPBC|nr:hypothetical protein ASPBRDRAFT_192819 [Aspergillus brasiliensis CBS 101740]
MSFYALLQRNGLLVRPPLWTSRHLDTLGCQFDEIRTLPSSSAEAHTSSFYSLDLESHDASDVHARDLATDGAILMKLFALVDILVYAGSPLRTRETRGKINFYFAGRVVHRLECTTFWRCLQNSDLGHSAADLLIGYLYYDDQEGYHRECEQERRARRLGQPSAVQRSSGEKRLLTRDWKRDPYLVCVLLSLGQLQRRLRHPTHLESYASRLLVVNPSDSQFIYLYEAQISAEVLECLDRPKAARSVHWPLIRRYRIPFRPYDTFRHRREEVLLQER